MDEKPLQIVGDTCKRQTTPDGPDFCRTCSDAIYDWVKWEGHTFREAHLIAQLAPRLMEPYDPRLSA